MKLRLMGTVEEIEWVTSILETEDRLEDIDGANIIYLYYILNYNMDIVSKEVNISKRSCWRHLDHAVEELDYVLRA